MDEAQLGNVSAHIAVLLWLASGIALCGLLTVAYGYILLDQRKLKLYQALDAWMQRRLPTPWRWLKARAASTRKLHVGLGAVALVAAAVTFLMAELVEGWLGQEELFVIDRFVHRVLVGSSNPKIEAVLGSATHLGSFDVGLVLSLVLAATLIYRRASYDLFALLLVMGLGELTAWGMKLVFARPRPDQSLVAATGNAFPSGHSFTAIALYGFIAYLVWGWTDRTWVRLSITALCGGIVLLVCVSRVVLRVHWFSDVLGGFILGLGWLVASLLLTRSLQSADQASAT